MPQLAQNGEFGSLKWPRAQITPWHMGHLGLVGLRRRAAARRPRPPGAGPRRLDVLLGLASSRDATTKSAAGTGAGGHLGRRRGRWRGASTWGAARARPSPRSVRARLRARAGAGAGSASRGRRRLGRRRGAAAPVATPLPRATPAWRSDHSSAAPAPSRASDHCSGTAVEQAVQPGGGVPARERLVGPGGVPEGELDVAVEEDGEAGAVGADQAERRCVLGRGQEPGHGPRRLAPGVGLARGGRARRRGTRSPAPGAGSPAGKATAVTPGGPQDHAVAGDHPEPQVVEGGHRVTSLRSVVRP